jgi:hypothetical protein
VHWFLDSEVSKHPLDWLEDVAGAPPSRLLNSAWKVLVETPILNFEAMLIVFNLVQQHRRILWHSVNLPSAG